MNDPNDLVFRDGVYHAFYQHNPDADVWGPMHWRHATSPDLFRWRDCGIVLAPDEHGCIFSGSAVVDHHNSSGLAPGGQPGPLVAVFTHHLEQSHPGPAHVGRRQRQSLAYSTDDGAVWHKYHGNPVLDPRQADFRDPGSLDGRRPRSALGDGGSRR